MVAKFCIAAAFLLVGAATAWASGSVLNQSVQDKSTRADVFVTIKNGTIRGYTARASNNNTFYTYMHIPFAKPPVGELRFKNPVSPDAWEGVLDGTVFPPACPQFLTGVVEPSEDCLYLNVYTSRLPNETGRAPAPVMVFMYGGGFALGETSYYTGNRFLSQDIVLVVPNYRVNLFGFFSTGDEVSPGNYGMKDQNLALRWVQENIAAFGGDPSRVTIFGESAGAASVTLHLISPLSRGLFHGMIAQSGSILSPWAVDYDPLGSAKRISEALNCPTGSSQEMLDCLKVVPTANTTTSLFAQMLQDLSTSSMKLSGTTPVIEPNLPGAFLAEDPLKLLREGDISNVPVIYGANREDGAFVIGGFHFLGFGRNAVVNETLNDPVWLREVMMNEILSTFDVSDNGLAAPLEETMALAYFPGKNRLDFDSITSGLVDMFTALTFKAPVKKTSDILSNRGFDVYLYSFDYQSPNRRNSLWWYLFELLVPIVGGTIPHFEHGVIHADDLMYQFNLPFVLEEEDEKFSDMFVKLWTNFATYGTPTPEATAEYPVWPKYSTKEPNYMILNATPVVASDYAAGWAN